MERLPEEEEKQITSIVRSADPGIKGIHKLRTRKAGHVRHVDLHVQVAPGMTVDAAHLLTHHIANLIRDAFPETITTVHVEPWRELAPPQFEAAARPVTRCRFSGLRNR